MAEGKSKRDLGDEIAAMKAVFSVLENLDNDEQRLRAMCCACVNLGLYGEAHQFLSLLRDREDA